MSSRRKRAPPMKVDEERQQQLHWNMHEDLRSEPLTMTVGEQACSDADSSSDCIIIDEGPPESALHRDKKRRSETVSVLEATEEETRLSVTLNVTVSPYRVDNSWKAFLGDFALQLLPKESLVEHFSERTFTLSPSESSSQFLIYVHSECKNVEKQENVLEGSAGVCSKGIRVESSFSSDMLQDLAWLQKRRGIKLYQRPDGTHTIKWQDVLDIISKALTDNNMEFTQISRIKTFQENLSAFKYDPHINILLLPLHTGSNGLTIIEATHVLLVEPILNPAHELQAIGRVHRIGQTKPTIVHRFLIKATIEERMQAMLKTAERSHTSSSGKHSEASVLTVAGLADLFTKENEELE